MGKNFLCRGQHVIPEKVFWRPRFAWFYHNSITLSNDT